MVTEIDAADAEWGGSGPSTNRPDSEVFPGDDRVRINNDGDLQVLDAGGDNVFVCTGQSEESVSSGRGDDIVRAGPGDDVIAAAELLNGCGQ